MFAVCSCSASNVVNASREGDPMERPSWASDDVDIELPLIMQANRAFLRRSVGYAVVGRRA